MGTKTITMVKYQDLGLVRYNDTIGGIEEIPLINRPLFFEYIDGEVNLDKFIKDKYKVVRGNCLGDYILVSPLIEKIEKNHALNMLEFIVKASSLENSFVLDCFCGSGTTLVASERLQRNWIGIDQSEEAIKVCEKRLSSCIDIFSQGYSRYTFIPNSEADD